VRATISAASAAFIPLIATRFCLDVSPVTIFTEDAGTLNNRESRATSSVLALPSVGGALSLTLMLPSPIRSLTSVLAAPGWTLIVNKQFPFSLLTFLFTQSVRSPLALTQLTHTPAGCACGVRTPWLARATSLLLSCELPRKGHPQTKRHLPGNETRPLQKRSRTPAPV